MAQRGCNHQADFRILDRPSVSAFTEVRCLLRLPFLRIGWINTSAGMPNLSCKLRIIFKDSGRSLRITSYTRVRWPITPIRDRRSFPFCSNLNLIASIGSGRTIGGLFLIGLDQGYKNIQFVALGCPPASKSLEGRKPADLYASVSLILMHLRQFVL